MILQAFTIYDCKAAAYMTPFFARTSDEAIRDFQYQANNPKSRLYVHAEDMILYHVGEFDDQTGILCAVGHRSLGKAVEFRRPDPTSISQE